MACGTEFCGGTGAWWGRGRSQGPGHWRCPLRSSAPEGEGGGDGRAWPVPVCSVPGWPRLSSGPRELRMKTAPKFGFCGMDCRWRRNCSVCSRTRRARKQGRIVASRGARFRADVRSPLEALKETRERSAESQTAGAPLTAGRDRVSGHGGHPCPFLPPTRCASCPRGREGPH